MLTLKKISILFVVYSIGGFCFGQNADTSYSSLSDTVSAEAPNSFIGSSFRPVSISYGLVVYFNVGDFYHKSLLDNNESWFSLGYDNSKSSNEFELSWTLPWTLKDGSRRFICGLGYEQIRNSVAGFMDVEYYEYPSWISYFSPVLHGDKIEINHKINIYTLVAGYNAKIIPRRNRVGTGFIFFMPVKFYDIREDAKIEMQGNYQIVQLPDKEVLSYATDYFSGNDRSFSLALQPGVRVELYFGNHFSLTLPELSYEFTVYSSKLDGVQYNSTVDDDSIVIRDRKHQLHTFLITFGASLHF